MPFGMLKGNSLLWKLAIGAVLLLALVRALSLPPYLPAVVILLGVTAYIVRLYLPRRRRAVLAELRAQWGKEVDRDHDVDSLGGRYEAYRGHEDMPDSLDAASWADLNMDELYWTLDRTHTNAGELMLYVMLRDAVKSPDLLAARGRAVNAIKEDAPLREALLFRLHQVGRDPLADLVSLLWEEKEASVGRGWIYNLFAGAAALSLLSLIPLGSVALVYVVLPIFVINCILTQVIARNDVLMQLGTLRYLGKVIAAARDLALLDRVDLLPWTEPMGRAARSAEGVARRIRVLNPETGLSTDFFNLVGYYAAAFFLVEVRTFNRVMAEVKLLRDELKTVVRLVGELDALQSVASFRCGLPRYCEPEFIDGAHSLHIEDGWHPLVSEPVPNSLHCDGEDLFITGSNMAGKSTFLRMVAVNAVLAQTIHTCCAGRYRATRFRRTTSISHNDEVASGTSYFLAESRRLLHVLRCAESDGMPFLCIIDEMLRGTNSVERHAASLAILRQLARTPAVIIVASHDTELGQMIEEQYRLHHFEESFKEDRMIFDYQLKSGVCGIGNAIRTLDYVGFPGSVIADAGEQVARIQASGGIYRIPAGVGRDTSLNSQVNG